MSIREDLVASAAKFLQDPTVASSSPDSRVAFLKAKNLTPVEVNAALARAGLDGSVPGNALVAPQSSPAALGAPTPYYGAPPTAPYGPQPFPPYGWQPAPHETRRDWRDWFIMATVVGGVGYGLFSLTKRYVYPLVAPPTPDRLEQDKQEINEQFDKAFSLVEQLTKDTEALKAAEEERTQRIDAGLAMLETALGDLKSAGKRREEDAERLRDDVRTLKAALPKALEAQRDVTDNRLRDVNAELVGLKTLIGQRMTPVAPVAPPAPVSAPASVPAAAVAPAPAVNGTSSTALPNGTNPFLGPSGSVSSVSSTYPRPTASSGSGSPNSFSTYAATLPGGSTQAPPLSAPLGAAGKASIPAWQRAMATKSAPVAGSSGATTPAATPTKIPVASGSGSSSPQAETSGSA